MKEPMIAYSVIRMSKSDDGDAPTGIYGARPGHEGIRVEYDAGAVIRGVGYRLTATKIQDGESTVKTRPHTDVQAIQQVIDDLQKQKARIGAKVRQKIKAERGRLLNARHPSIRVMLFFKKSTENPDISLAHYGFGIDGRHGMIIFGNQGVTTGHTLVNIFFHSEKSCGWSMAVEDKEVIDRVIADLERQIKMAKAYHLSQIEPGLGKPSGECKKLLKQAIRERDNQAA